MQLCEPALELEERLLLVLEDAYSVDEVWATLAHLCAAVILAQAKREGLAPASTYLAFQQSLRRAFEARRRPVAE